MYISSRDVATRFNTCIRVAFPRSETLRPRGPHVSQAGSRVAAGTVQRFGNLKLSDKLLPEVPNAPGLTAKY